MLGLYEQIEVEFEDLAMRFMNIRKSVYQFTKMEEKIMMCAVLTSARTGLELTFFRTIIGKNPRYLLISKQKKCI